MKSIGLAHFLRLDVPNGGVHYFQNFFINSSVAYGGHSYTFLPFGFSGVTFNRSGANSQAELIFPNRELVRGFIDRSVMQQWVAEIDTALVTDIDSKQAQKLYNYTGSVSGGTWKGDSLMLALGSILDAVSANVPLRNMETDMVGPLPMTGAISL